MPKANWWNSSTAGDMWIRRSIVPKALSWRDVFLICCKTITHHILAFRADSYPPVRLCHRFARLLTHQCYHACTQARDMLCSIGKHSGYSIRKREVADVRTKAAGWVRSV